MKKTFLSLIFLFFLCFCFSQSSENKVIDSLKMQLNKKKDSKNKTEIMLLLVDNYFEINKDSSEVYIKKVINLTKDNSTLLNSYVLALLKYAQLFIVRGDYETSSNYYDKAWSKLENNYDYDLNTKYYGDYGVLNFYKGDFKTALLNFNKALKLAEKEKREEDQLRFLNNKALAMSYLGEAEPSLDVHEKAIILAEKLNDSTALGKSFNNIGLIYEDMKAYEKALEYYLHALEIKKNGKSEVDIANSLFNVAGMYKEIGEKNEDNTLYTKAEDYYKLALEKGKKINYGKIILFTKTGIAQLATARNKPLEAIEIYKEVVDDAIKSKDNQTLRVTYLNLGVNFIKVNNLKEAEKFLLKALPLIEEAENPFDLANVYENLSSLYSKKNNFEKAYSYIKKQYDTEKVLNNNSLEDKISNYEVKYQTEKKEKEILSQRADIAEKELNINQKNTQIIGLGLLAIVISVLGYLLYNQQKLKNQQLKREGELKEALVKIETQNTLQEQRLRISRDLHDNIGAQLTFIISSIENLQYGFKIKNEKLTNKLSSITSFTKETIYELRDTIWAMNKNTISLEDLEARISNFIDKAGISSTDMQFKFTIDKSLSKDIKFTSVIGMNIYRIIQEAINNSMKYAEASKLDVGIMKQDEDIEFSIADNGCGFDQKEVILGNGLNNMGKRAKEIASALNIESEINEGTRVVIRLPFVA